MFCFTDQDVALIPSEFAMPVRPECSLLNRFLGAQLGSEPRGLESGQCWCVNPFSHPFARESLPVYSMHPALFYGDRFLTNISCDGVAQNRCRLFSENGLRQKTNEIQIVKGNQ